MENQQGDTRERILAVTLKLINDGGVSMVTVRRVAAEARVNVAAVNYHFGSKESLIRQALQGLMGDFFTAFDLLDGQGTAKARLQAFLHAYIEAALRYPDIVRGMVGLAASGESQKDHRAEGQAEADYERFVRSTGMERISLVIGQATGRTERADLAIMAVQMMSSLSVPLLIGPAARRVTGIDLTNRMIRMRYVELLIERLGGGE